MNKNEWLQLLEKRFNEYHYLYPNINFNQILKCLSDTDIEKLMLLEETGEIAFLRQKDDYYEFFDISIQTPKRLSLCYDKEARIKRKKFPPLSSVEEEVEKLNAKLLDKEDYEYLQSIIEVDTKTSSWIHTPEEVRNLGGALFMERRYGEIFIYHNGADSYYSSRGFRCKYCVKVSS